MADEQQFLLDFVNSKFWKWFEDILNSRIQSIIKMKSNPNLSETGRVMLDGSLVELQDLKNIPINAAEFFNAQIKADASRPLTIEELAQLLAERFPEKFKNP